MEFQACLKLKLIKLLILCMSIQYTQQLLSFKPPWKTTHVLAFSNDGFPANFLYNDILMGQSVDMAEVICDRAGKKCEFAVVPRTHCWSSNIDFPAFSIALDAGYFDACINLPISKERLLQKNMADTNYFKTPNPVAFVRRDSNITIPRLKFCNEFVLAYASNLALTPKCAIASGLWINETLVKEVKVTSDLVGAMDKLQIEVLTGKADLALALPVFLNLNPELKILTDLSCRLELDIGLNIMVPKYDTEILKWWEPTLKEYICNDTINHNQFCNDLKVKYNGSDPHCNIPGVDIDCSDYGGPALIPPAIREPIRRENCFPANLCNATTKILCENHPSIVLKCIGDAVLRIQSANYGRTDHVVCPSTSNHNNVTDCISKSSEVIVSDICDEKNICVLEATTSLYGDTCPGTYKYLEVTFYCQFQNGTCGEYDACGNQPCQNDGVCTDLEEGYMCECVPGYNGINCEININECESSPCVNGGTCIDDINRYSCSCLDGYTGVHCEININECESSPCVNGGTCVDDINRYSCSCLDGYTGVHCEININECESSPCVNGGTCVDDINRYSCSCLDGYTGVHCEININECESSPCVNGGTCVDDINKYTCMCLDGYTGVHCEININECESSPCVNYGTCVDGLNGYTCVCLDGFTGVHCEINIDECSSNPCVNNGTCIDKVNGYECQCIGGFTGEHCEINIDDCGNSPCENNGTCIDGIQSYTCECPEYFTGQNCETDVCKDDIHWKETYRHKQFKCAHCSCSKLRTHLWHTDVARKACIENWFNILNHCCNTCRDYRNQFPN